MPAAPYFDTRLAEIRAEHGITSQSQRRGFVYFATTGDLVKIGWAVDVPSRIASLNTGNAAKLGVAELCHTYFEAEAMLHKHFAKDRVRGEWFRFTLEMEDLWGDIFDYQGSHATGDEEDLSDVFINLTALHELMFRD
jgi:hypothetical protein